MSSFSLSGGVEVFGFISPSDTTDQYPVIDPLYGIDGLRNVNTLFDLNNIPSLRRRAGMIVGVSGGTTYYKLNLPPWNNTISDWSIFNSGSSGSTISGDYLPLSGGTVSGGTEFINGLTANTISATTYLNLPQDIFVTGGTYSSNTITFTNNSGGTFNVTGITFSGGSSVLGDYLPLSGGTVTGETIFTQGLYSNNENVGLIIDAGNLKRVGFMKYGGLEGAIARISTQNFRILRTTGTDINDGTNAVTDFYIEGDGKVGIGTTTPITNLDISGNTRIEGSLTANTISASTYLNLPQDIFVTGGTYSNGTTTFTNNSGGTFSVNGFYTGETSYVNSLTTGIGLSGNSTSGDITIINTDPDQVVTISGGTGILTGGTYPNFTITNSLPDQTVILNNGTNISVGGTYPNFTIDVTGLTDNNRYVTGYTYNENTFTISDNSGSTYGATINSVTGLTVNGNLSVTGTTSANIISATTYQNLPQDIFVTGGTYSNGTTTFTNNSGGTFNVVGYFTGYTNVVNTLTTGNGLSANTTNGNITIINSSPDQVVTLGNGTGISTSGTYPNFTITNTLPDQTVVLNNGSNISVTGTYPTFTISTTGLTDNNRFVTAYTYNNNTFTISDNSGSTYTATINSVTGLTVNGNLTITGTTSSNIISATTYQNLPIEIQAAASDETSAITTGTAKVTFRAPCAFTLTGVRASLTTAQTSGNIFTVDINLNGTSVLSTKLTIDNTERTSTTAVTPPVISTSSITDDGEISVDVDQIGDGTAKGLKVTLLGVRI